MKVLRWLKSLIVSAFCGTEDLTLCHRGWSEFESGNYEEALRLFTECVQTGNIGDATLARTYRNMGLASHRCQNFLAAIDYYDKALALVPSDSWDDHVNKGNAFSELREYEAAFTEYDRALAINPHYHEAHYNRGVCFEKQDRIAAAIEEYRQAYRFGLRSELLYERLVVHGIIDEGIDPLQFLAGELDLPAGPDQCN